MFIYDQVTLLFSWHNKDKIISWSVCGLQYSSNQLKTQADNSPKLATDIEALNDWNKELHIAWNWKKIKREIKNNRKIGYNSVITPFYRYYKINWYIFLS